jgi:hypothetical protein
MIHDLFTSRNNGVDPANYVGSVNRLWYNPDTNTLRYSDGNTPGGLGVNPGSSSVTPGGSNGAVQYKGGGTFDGTNDFHYHAGNSTLTVSNAITASNITVSTTLIANTVNISYLNSTHSNLGNVSNVHLNGGNAHELLQTDGSGNLAWVAITFVETSNTSNYAAVANTANIANSTGNANYANYAGTANISNTSANANYALAANTANSATTATTANTVTSAAQSNITSLGNLTSLTVTGVTNLGEVGNVKITSGGNGQYLQTDGTGNLTWATIDSAPQVAGNNNQVQYNSNGAFAASPNLTFNGTLLTTRNFKTTVANLGAPANITITGGSDGYVLTTDGAGNLSWSESSGGAPDGSDGELQFKNGNVFGADSNLSYNSSTQTLTVAGTLRVATSIETTGASPAPQLSGFIIANTVSADLGSVANLRITGGNANQYLKTDGTGNLSWYTPAGGGGGSPGGNSGEIQLNTAGAFGGTPNLVFANNTLTVTSNIVTDDIISNTIGGNTITATDLLVSNVADLGDVSNITITGGTNAQFLQTDGNGNLVWTGDATFDSLIINGNGLVTGTWTVQGTTSTVNATSLNVEDPIIKIGGFANGDPLTLNDGKDRGILGHYYTTEHVDTFMGWDNSNAEFAFGSNVSDANDIVTFNSFGNVRAHTFKGNIVARSANLGNVANMTVTGGSNGQFLRTDGNGTLTWATTYGDTNVGSYIPNYTGNTNFTGSNISLGTVANLHITGGSNAQFLRTDGSGNLSWVTGYGNSDVGSYLAAYTGNINFSGSNISLGSVANLHIANGTSGQFLQTDGNGNLSWANLASVSGNIGTTGNITANYVNANKLYGTVLTAAQPYITSLGNVGNLTVTGNIIGNVDGYSIGYKAVPQVTMSGNVTLALTDSGKHYYNTATGASQVTVPNAATVGFDVGTAITIVNKSSSNLTITPATGVSIFMAGNSTSNSRVMATYSTATLLCTNTNEWFLTGTGLT